MTKADATMAFLRADDEWSRELHRIFDRQASDMRYMPPGRGDAGSRLRELHDAREAAREAWEKAG